MKWLVGMEYSGKIRSRLRLAGHDAWSICDIPSEDDSPYHIVGNVLDHLNDGWDAGIFHPTCTFFNLAGIQWMYHPEDTPLPAEHRRRHPKYPNRMNDFLAQVATFKALQECAIPIKCIENSQPHGLAMEHVGRYTQLVQPWMFGSRFKKGAALWLYGLKPLVSTEIVPEYFRIAACHNASPGPLRWKERSRTDDCIADQMVAQWASENSSK